MAKKPITKVEVAGLFWKDLADWRTHPDYDEIWRDIARIVLRRAKGVDGGDAPFTGGDRWGGIHHAHITSKLIVFTGYPEEGTLKLCALTKHDAYGFRNERKSLAANFAAKMQRTLNAPSVARPDWSSLRWRDPGGIPGHPELPELFKAALEPLLAELFEEGDSFERLERRREEMSPVLAQAFEGAWFDALVEAQGAVQAELVSRVRPHLRIFPQRPSKAGHSPCEFPGIWSYPARSFVVPGRSLPVPSGDA